MDLDVIVFAAHPDDAELAMGGTIAKMTSEGTKVGIVDMCRGELGTRGNRETRALEAADASKILGVETRDNLGIPDGQIRPSQDYMLRAVKKIREYRPKIIFAPYFNDRHPDHIGASAIIKEAMFFSGLTRIETFEKSEPQKPYRPHKLFYFMQTYEFEPTFVIDVSPYYETKMKALAAYGTQFFNPDYKSEEPETFISKMNFTKYIEGRARVYGFHIGKDYGEPFYCEEKIELDINGLIKNYG